MANETDQNRMGPAPTETVEPSLPSHNARGGYYELHVKGQLSSQWSDWLEGLEVKLLDNGEMILCGTIVDQAALMGVLIKLNRLNLTLISVNQVEREEGREER